MELRSLFVLYIDYSKRKSLQKRIQSSIPDIISFIQETGSCIGYCRSIAKMYQKLDECFTGICYANNEKRWPCWCWYKTGEGNETCLYYDKSPNRVWHLDSYDKFKPFGFESKRCIDGDSRCILWLNILRSNKYPKEVCNIFVNYFTVTKRIPQKIAVNLGRRTFL